MKQKLFMLVWDIDVKKGGINRVMLNRSSMLSDHFDVAILTLDYKQNYLDVSNQLTEMGRLHPDVKLLNINDYYRNKNTKGTIQDSQVAYYNQQVSLFEDGFEIQDDELKTDNYARYFKNGIYQKYKKWNTDGTLKHIDYFNENRSRTKREEFDTDGSVHRVIYYDLALNTPVQEVLYTADGYCYLNRWYKPEDGEFKFAFLFDRKSHHVLKFSSSHELNAHWLTEMTRDDEDKPIVICDGPGSTPILHKMGDSIYKMVCIHSNHYAYPHTFGSPIKKNHRAIFKDLDKLDAVVVLTNQQKKDINTEFGDHHNLHVIPHAVPEPKQAAAPKDKKLFTIVSRYHKEKRIDLAIKAFKTALQSIPEARLEIYGEGTDRKRLTKIINELEITDAVSLKGFAENVEDVFTSSLATLLTSQFEGFSLAILESMACGTPVISFDIAYGPSDIITNGYDGELVADGDIDAMAEAIVYLYNHPDEAVEMGKRAQESALSTYSYTKHKQDWLSLLSRFN